MSPVHKLKKSLIRSVKDVNYRPCKLGSEKGETYIYIYIVD